MEQTKTDLRVVRTRKLIMDSFIELSGKKEFKDITVTDITKEAMVNRATFYYHFEDIYDLLEKVLCEVLLINLDRKAFEKDEFSEQAIVSLFTAITDFQNSLSNRCHRGYEDTIARIIREQLEIIFYNMLKKQRQEVTDDAPLKAAATALSWGLYGASVEWRRQSEKLPPEQYIKPLIPYIMSGFGG